jgi:hypothetical protein
VGPFTDINEAVEHLARRERLPFTCYSIGPTDGHISIAVSEVYEPTATAFFADHPLRFLDGTTISVDIVIKAAWSWTTEPLGGPARDPDASVLDGLLGVDVQTATRRANAAGWIVRAIEPEAAITLDLRHNRVNLTYSPVTGDVTQVYRG